jgi:hypothetical protein
VTGKSAFVSGPAGLHDDRVKVLSALLAGLLSLPLLAGGCSTTRTCTTNADCGANETCAFRIGSCSTEGECKTPPSPECGFETSYCGCDGTMVTGGCGYPAGYASGPTLGGQACPDTGGSEAGAADAGGQ